MSTPKCERITRREQKIARTRANCLLQEMRKLLRDRYRMTFRIAGSGYWGTMVKRPDGSYDLDYQIFITHNSKDYEKSVKGDPKKVKNDIRNAFNKLRNKGESFHDSTTAITLTNETDSVHYTIDFVIVTDFDGKSNIIRQNKDLSPPVYTWNELPHKYEGSYRYFKNLTYDTFIRSLALLELSADTDPFSLIKIVLLGDPVKQKVFVVFVSYIT